MVIRARGAAPDDDVAAREPNAPRAHVALGASEKEYGRQPERHGYDGRAEVALVLVLMQRQSRAALVAIDETTVGSKAFESRRSGGGAGERRKGAGHGGPGTPTRWIEAIVAVAAPIRHPAHAPATGHRNGHAMPARCEHVA